MVAFVAEKSELLNSEERNVKSCSRIVQNLSVLCFYLVILVCIQFGIIVNINSRLHGIKEEFENRIDCNLKESHRIVKRESGQAGWQWLGVGSSEGQYCPQGCVRRRRRKGSTSSKPEPPIPSSYTERNEWNWNYDGHAWNTYPGSKAERGRQGSQGLPGSPGQAGLLRSPGYAGSPGSPGQVGLPGSPGYAGSPGSPGQAGLPGSPGYAGSPGSPGLAGSPGSPGQVGLPGSPGYAGSLGSRGHAGLPGYAGLPGSPGQAGSPGYVGASGGRGSFFGIQGPPGQRSSGGHSYGQSNYYDLRSGTTRGDQGSNGHKQLPPRNQTGVNELLREFRLYAHPECKDDVNHKAMMDTLKDTGKVSFMIMVDLQDNKYCIVHA